MKAEEIVFTCGLCGKKHPALPPFIPIFTEEDALARKQAWLEADAKLAKSPSNEHLERAYMKAWFAYGATMSNGVLRMPETITTTRKGGKYIFLCTNHEQLKEDSSYSSQQCGDGDDCGGHRQEAGVQGQAH